ncbi:hypothetical protein HDE78_000420 [Rhodanobacter sp. K2T2]|nr:hypothetical protein [Rhodanobacter sp. K2T2]
MPAMSGGASAGHYRTGSEKLVQLALENPRPAEQLYVGIDVVLVELAGKRQRLIARSEPCI